jgi:outer membrane lipoprotein-sorting protein/peroxiredoxin
MHRFTGIALMVLPLSCNLLIAQDAAEILKKVEETYKNLRSYDFVEVMAGDSAPADSGLSMHNDRSIRVARAPGRKSRFEQVGGLVEISDGEHTWQYAQQTNTYTMRAGASDGIHIISINTRDIKSARVLREEPVNLQSAPSPCYVVEVSYQPPSNARPGTEAQSTTYWVDKDRYLVLKTSMTTGRGSFANIFTETITKVVINQPLPDSLFQFTPPPGATQVEQLGRVPSPLLGKSLPDFGLRDPAGKEITTAGLHGKLVILNIERTWSEAIATPFLEMVHRAFRDKGVVVLYYVTGTPEEAREEATKLGYTLPIVTCPASVTPESLGFTDNYVRATIVADASGKVVYHSNGAGNIQVETAVVKALRDAGVW